MKIFTIGCLLLITNSVFAQSPINREQQRQLVTKMLLGRQLQNRALAAKTTGVQERLIGMDSYLPGTATVIDSAQYIYTGTHGSRFDFNYMQYNQLTALKYNTAIVDFAVYAAPALQPLIASDTSLTYVGSLSYPPTILYDMYNADHEVTGEHYYFSTSSSPFTGLYYSFSYNTSNMPVSAYTFSDTAGKPLTDTVGKNCFSYNASGQLIQDSSYFNYTGTWTPGTKYTYGYDGSGNVSTIGFYYYTTTSWGLYDTYTLTYNGSNQITSIEIDTGASLSPYSKEVFTYSGGADYFASDSMFYMIGASWSLSNIVSKHINSSGLPDTVRATYIISSGNYTISDYFTYDSYNNPVMQYDSAASIVTITHFYYETYTTSDVSNIPQQTDNTTIYPNPATNNITVKTDKIEPVRIMIINSLGQKLINTPTLTAANEHTLSLANIQSGIYWLFVYDNNNKLIHSQSFVKQ